MIKKKFISLFFPHDQKTHHNKSLDGLRGVAVLLVLLSHSSNASLFFHESLNFQKIGKVGVYLFFLLSAYLLDRQVTIAIRSKDTQSVYWKNYFLRRFLRIYPLFFLALLLHWLFTVVGIQTVIGGFTDVWKHLLLMKGDSIFWSIPAEFKYYFISPIIILICHKVIKWRLSRLIFAYSILIISTIFLEGIYALPQISTIKYFTVFLTGTLIAIYEIVYKNDETKGVSFRVLNVIGFISFAIVLISNPYFFEQLFHTKVDFHSSFFLLPYAILWGLILWSGKYGKGIIKFILETRILRYIGTISYSIYLFHSLVLKVVIKTSIYSPIKIYLFFVITILFSSITYLLVEKPMSKIRIRR
jgi:peptidoglycan/LPS O-acetylase OafA/YrhL